jgi:hypothetical protein
VTTLTAPRLLSPCCAKPLDGGPVIFWCTGCGHDVHGSTISREHQPSPEPPAGRDAQVTALVPSAPRRAATGGTS